MKDARAPIGRGTHPLPQGGRGAVAGPWRHARLVAVTLAALAAGGIAHAGGYPRVIILLSQTARGQSAEGRSEAPAVNLNGLQTAYSSNALNLVSPPFSNHRNQMYARDVAITTSELVSKSAGGTAGNRPSQLSGFPPGISGEGRFVTFSSSAINLVPNGTNGLENVFVYDRQLGVMELISAGVDGPANGPSVSPKISGDGRFVVFQSSATNLPDSDDNAFSDIFVYDRLSGDMRRVSVGLDGAAANGNSITPNISEDGRAVAFASRATNLVPQATSGAFEEIFVTEWDEGFTELVSVSSGGNVGNAKSFLPALSSDGSQVAFKSEATNLVPNDTNGVPDVFVRDRPAGTTQRVSVDSFGNQSNGLSGGPGISGDGRFVAFASFASNFVPDDGNGLSDVYVYDRFPPHRQQGEIARVTVGMNGAEPNDGVSDFPVTISTDGRWIGFSSAASNLVPNDFNNEMDSFLACNPFDAFDCAPPTPTPTVTETPTPTPPDEPLCVGDCNGDGSVTIDELIRMVNIALDRLPLCPNDVNDGCLAGDANCDCQITVDEIIRAVQNSLNGCHDYGDCGPIEHEQICCDAPPPTRTVSPTRTIAPTPAATATRTFPHGGPCVGDCNGDGEVTVTDLVRMVSIALSLQPVCPASGGGGGCLAGDANCDCQITVDEIIQAVNNALFGCTTFNTCPEPQHTTMCCGPS